MLGGLGGGLLPVKGLDFGVAPLVHPHLLQLDLRVAPGSVVAARAPRSAPSSGPARRARQPDVVGVRLRLELEVVVVDEGQRLDDLGGEDRGLVLGLVLGAEELRRDFLGEPFA